MEEEVWKKTFLSSVIIATLFSILISLSVFGDKSQVALFYIAIFVSSTLAYFYCDFSKYVKRNEYEGPIYLVGSLVYILLLEFVFDYMFTGTAYLVVALLLIPAAATIIFDRRIAAVLSFVLLLWVFVYWYFIFDPSWCQAGSFGCFVGIFTAVISGLILYLSSLIGNAIVAYD